MYWLLGIDTLLRITAAMLFLFVLVPAIAWKRPQTFERLEWFWWCLGAGMIALTLAGQLLTLFNIASTATYVVLLLALVIVLRARRRSLTAAQLMRAAYRTSVLSALNILEGRVHVKRRILRFLRRGRARMNAALAPAHVAWAAAAWTAVVAAAAITRLYRPFATANLGFSDTYVHLYLMRLLDEGRQVDPAWGPYPRGMHFLLLAIERLTNADTILLMNFFGACAGILIVLAVADAARRMGGTTLAALVAGLAFATMVGGPHQSFMLGPSIATDDPAVAHEVLRHSYQELSAAGEYDVLLTVFQRQCATLPQELATVLLFPAALFLFDWLRGKGDRGYRLAGFVLCTAAIAATHSGVLIPLALLCAVGVAACAIGHRFPLRDAVRGALYGALGVLAGSSWLLGYLRYRSATTAPHTESTAEYYFPFLRRIGDAHPDLTYVVVTPFLIAMVVIALIVLITNAFARRESFAWASISFVVFFLIHASGVLHLPEIVEARRNAIWLAMSIALLAGIAASILAERRRFAAAIPAIAVAGWLFTVPAVFAAPMRQKIVDYSGYGSTALAVVRISRSLEPFSWTLVSYGQEFPMVLGRGFHLPAADFLGQYDPAEARLRIPTRYVFIAVEKHPHRFQINNWALRFDRAEIEERLQTWCSLYNLNHRDMRIFLDDENVRVYMIERRG